MKIIDISLPLDGKTIVYPGNPKVSIKKHKGQISVYSEITFGSHTGTHLDAPRHVFKNAPGVDKIDLKKMIGDCRVLGMTHIKESIKVNDLKKAKIKKGERILVKTNNSIRGFEKFRGNYIYLDGDAAEYLAKKKIALFGIDYLTVKQRGSSDTRPHDALLKNNIVIVEGLNLLKVKPGKYNFIGLPLKFTDLDGSPIRAVLVR